MSELAPQPYGRYTLLKKIATGGMAEIFLARQQGPGRFERSLVIKRILPHLVTDPAFVEMFLDEAALAAQLNHPHIGQVYDFGEAEGSYFIAMELIRGPDLRTLLAACTRAQETPPVAVSLRLITQVLSALDYAHRATDEQGARFNLVHRDVTPQNILVTPEGTAKLVDFGIAKAATASHQTAAGMVKGKLAYLAPEQVTAQDLDGRCDEYAAALVLYDLLTLHRGLPVTGPEGLLIAVEAKVTPITTYRQDLPATLVELLRRALSREREARFPDCRAMAVAIDELLVAQGIAVSEREVAGYLTHLEQRNGKPLSELSGPLPATPSGTAAPPLGTGLEATDVAVPAVAPAPAPPLDPQVGVSTMPLPPAPAPPVRPVATDPQVGVTTMPLPAAAPVLKKPTRNRLPSQAELLAALAKAQAAQGQPTPAATTQPIAPEAQIEQDARDEGLRLPAGPSTGRVPVRPSPDAPTAELHLGTPPPPEPGASTLIGLSGMSTPRPNPDAPTAELRLGAPPPPEPGASTFIGLGALRPPSASEPELGSLNDIPAVDERPGRVPAARSAGAAAGSYAVGALEALLGLAFIAGGVHTIIERGPAVVPLAQLLLMGALGLWLGTKALANFRPTPTQEASDRSR